MNKIYYDPTGGFLYGIDSNNNPKIVKTDACVMMPENVFVDSNGYIHVKNLNDTETIIQDELGNPASIMGPAGPTGQTGSQGVQGPAGKDGVSIKLIDSLLNLEQTGQTAYIYMLTEDDYDENLGKVEAGSLYEHNGNAWANRGSIRGPKGIQGVQGIPGRPSVFKGTISTPTDMDNKVAEGAQIGDSYIISGVDDSIQLPIGEHNGSIFTVIDSEGRWDYSGNIRGPQGPAGESGKDGANGAPGTKFIVPTNQFTDQNIHSGALSDNDMPWQILQDGDYTISVDTQTFWAWSESGGGFTKLFTLKGDTGTNGTNGLTPFIGKNGNWWIGTTDTGVQAEGKDGQNPFTDEEAQTLKELPNTLNDLQGQNVSQFQTISEQIKEVSDNLNYANAQNAGQFGLAFNRINDLETRLAALEKALQNIDLAGLAVAYPIPTEE